MTNDQLIELAREADPGFEGGPDADGTMPDSLVGMNAIVRFAALVTAHAAKAERQACIDIIEAYRIPVGNSPAGEMACEWTYKALHEIRDDIRARDVEVE
jgi:hypothetical protein